MISENIESLQSGFVHFPNWAIWMHFILVQAARPFGTDLLRWQWFGLLASLCVGLCPWIVPGSWLTWMRIRFHAFALNQTRAICISALFPMVVRVALLPVAPVLPPSVHDDFSLLLLADTFRSGRLTNPTHPFWKHFETVHVIQQPTYNSMYPPGFGAFMALGQLLHDPWIGVLLAVGLMCGALCWMLQSWVPPAWAFGGALTAALQIGIGSYWMNSYVGGAPVPAMAGALLLGAMPRFLRKPSWSLGVIFALGVILLVNTRPFEGTVLSIICVGVAFRWHYRRIFGRCRIALRQLAPAAFVLLLGGMATCYYSWRVTGSPLKMAYMVNRETYGWPENLAILPPKSVTLRYPILQNVYLLEISHRQRYATLGRMFDSWSARCAILWEFYVGPSLTLALVMLPWVLRNPKVRGLAYVVLFMLGLNTLQLMAYPQHVSPETAIFSLLLVLGMRHLYVAAHRRGFRPERLVATIVLGVACGAGFNLFMVPLHLRPGTFWEWPHWPVFDEARALIAAKLETMPGKHLIFVSYSATHSAHEEWVYNAADIDHSKVVWANMMDRKSDLALRRYFHDRQVWIVQPDRDINGFLPLTEKTYNESADPKMLPID